MKKNNSIFQLYRGGQFYGMNKIFAAGPSNILSSFLHMSLERSGLLNIENLSCE
jgi:hypothetical protein